MAAPASCSTEGPTALVDPFLVELLHNPRHRLTVLRMELDIQRFVQHPDLRQFEFQHLPTSYLRCAAHRVAQHYGLQTMAIESNVDSAGSKVIARKTSDSKYPVVCLSEVPAKLPEKEVSEQVKIVIRPRPNKSSSETELGTKNGSLRSVEERKEEYVKARARIFSGHITPEIEESVTVLTADGRSSFSIRDEHDYDRTIQEMEKVQTKDGTSRVAIFRDREKDRSDPDYDRRIHSHDRYARGVAPGLNFGLQGSTTFPPPFLHYGAGISQFGHLPANQTSVNYNPANSSLEYCALGSHQNAKDAAVYMQWPTPALMYANSYGHFRHAVFQAPVYHPSSFGHTQNC